MLDQFLYVQIHLNFSKFNLNLFEFSYSLCFQQLQCLFSLFVQQSNLLAFQNSIALFEYAVWRDHLNLLIIKNEYSFIFNLYCLFQQLLHLRLVAFPLHPVIYVIVLFFSPLFLSLYPLMLILIFRTGDNFLILVKNPIINPLGLLQSPAYFEFECLDLILLTKLLVPLMFPSVVNQPLLEVLENSLIELKSRQLLYLRKGLVKKIQSIEPNLLRNQNTQDVSQFGRVFHILRIINSDQRAWVTVDPDMIALLLGLLNKSITHRLRIDTVDRDSQTSSDSLIFQRNPISLFHLYHLIVLLLGIRPFRQFAMPSYPPYGE